MPLRFNMLLTDAGIDVSEVRLLRHQTKKSNGRTPYSLWRDDPAAFEEYQSSQNPEHRSRFNSKYWASFVVSPNGNTLFVGIYEVSLIGQVPEGTIDPLTDMPVGRAGIIYDQYACIRKNELSEYIGRLSVNWGNSPSASRAWVQRADKQDKEIIELTREFHDEEFPGFTKFIRPLSEIETMPLAWKAILSASKGVYLLACPRTGKHYIGSASGDGGFIGRWRDYVRNNHGGNVGLKLREPSDYLVSVLEVASSSSSTEDIIGLEEMWKKKLFSRDVGLNL